MPNTATANVKIIDTAFYMPQLKRSRRIWLYLPTGYSKTRKHFPVVYMHDGQNLFDESSAFGEEWQVDETLDNMRAKCIIVGIDNGRERRLTEYNFHDNDKFGKGEGAKYVDFIVDTLKPYIDTTYRTLGDRANTFTAGSSMGGLISFYAALHSPETFGGAGVFSPSFWLVPDIAKDVAHRIRRHTIEQHYFFYAGGKEGEGMVENVEAVTEVLKGTKHIKCHTIIDPEGEHSEATWRTQLPPFYKWVRNHAGL
jgi:metallo-beta-lactamase class B